jgi:hypothetical protein
MGAIFDLQKLLGGAVFDAQVSGGGSAANGAAISAVAGISAGSATVQGSPVSTAPGASISAQASILTGGAYAANQAMATTKDFEAFVTLDVMGCPLPVVRQAILLACVEFCRRSKVWKRDLGAGTTSAGVSTYAISVPSDAKVSVLESATVGGRDLFPGQIGGAGRPSRFTGEAGNVIRLFPVPDSNSAGEAIEVEATLEPTLTAATLPAVLLEYVEGIASGAKKRLMLQPNKAWTSVELAGYHGNAFESAIGEAFAKQAHGGAVSSLQIKPIKFGY